MSITVNGVRDGVISKLKQLYPDVKVTGEKIKQGLGDRRFFVKLLSGAQNRELGRRYRRMNAYDIHYFGPSNDECHTVAETLYGGMEYISVAPGTFRGTSMQHEIVDDVLHFFVDYDFHVIREKDSDTKMQTLKTGVNFDNG